MNQAAQTAKRSPEFAATYAAITQRRGKKIATIAISRKLLTRAYQRIVSSAWVASPPVDLAMMAPRSVCSTEPFHVDAGHDIVDVDAVQHERPRQPAPGPR